MVALAGFWLVFVRVDQANDLELDFLDVGQGDAILIKTPADQNILIDGGPDNAVIKRLSENLPWWDKTIDMMILTHPHDDHVNGLNDVIKRYRVKRVLYTGVAHNSPGYLNWLNLIKENHIPLIIIDRPQAIELGGGCQFKILYPFKSFLGEELDNLNNSSMVSKLSCGENNFLFTGDIEEEVERALLAAKIDLSAEVLKAGHHGSDTSSSENFLAAVKPKIAVIQVGEDNKFGHPSRRILKRLIRIGAAIYRNDISGTIKIFSDGNILYCDN